MGKKEELEYISKKLTRWQLEIDNHKALDYYDGNKAAEGIAMMLLNHTYGLQLEELNPQHRNISAIDLGDTVNEIAFQVTSQKDVMRKIKKTLPIFEKDHRKTYPNGIRFFFLNPQLPTFTEKQKSRFEKLSPGFKVDEHVYGVARLIHDIDAIYHEHPEHIAVITKVLTRESTDSPQARGTELLTTLPRRKIKLLGRQKDLQWLEQQVKSRHPLLLVNGIGGIGKTEVCKDFFYNHYSQYTFAGWFDYVSSLQESIANAVDWDSDIAREKMEAREDDTPEQRFNKIIRFLNGLNRPGETALLVVDNISGDDDPDLGRLFSLPPQVKVIANSRRFIKGFEGYRLDFPGHEVCRELFYRFYDGEPDDGAVMELIELCAGHTLTVELLASTARVAALSVPQLVKHLKEKGFNLKEAIPDRVDTTWGNEEEKKRFFEHMIRVFDLGGLNDAETHILSNLSVLPPVYIKAAEVKKWLKLKTGEDIDALVKKGWLRRDKGQIYMHPVIQEVVRFHTQPGVETCLNLITTLKDKFRGEPGDNLPEKKGYVQYADSVLLYIKGENRLLATLANNLAFIYEDLGQFQKALSTQKKALDIRKRVLKENHPELAHSYNNLSTIYMGMKQYKKALEFQLTALEIRKKVLDENHPEIVQSYNNLALIYKYLRKPEKALEIQLEVIKIRKKVRGETHHEHAISLHNLADMYHDLKRLDEARKFYLEALAIKEKILKKNNPSLALTFNGMSILYSDLHDYPTSIRYAEKAMAIYQELFPTGHPHLDSMKKNLEKIKKKMTDRTT